MTFNFGGIITDQNILIVLCMLSDFATKSIVQLGIVVT